MIINCIIVDDEPQARRLLHTYLSEIAGIHIVKICASAVEAYEALYTHKIDLMFLDIKMPVLSGIDFLRSLKNPPYVIFTTAYDKYAIEGYQLNVIDYLLKPVSISRIIQAVDKVKEKIRKPETLLLNVPDYVFIKQDGKLIKVAFANINYIEGMQNYVKLFLCDGNTLIASNTMKAFEDFLPAAAFIRIHRSYLVALGAIELVQGNVVKTFIAEIPIGLSYKENLMKIIGSRKL